MSETNITGIHVLGYIDTEIGNTALAEQQNREGWYQGREKSYKTLQTGIPPKSNLDRFYDRKYGKCIEFSAAELQLKKACEELYTQEHPRGRKFEITKCLWARFDSSSEWERDTEDIAYMINQFQGCCADDGRFYGGPLLTPSSNIVFIIGKSSGTIQFSTDQEKVISSMTADHCLVYSCDNGVNYDTFRRFIKNDSDIVIASFRNHQPWHIPDYMFGEIDDLVTKAKPLVKKTDKERTHLIEKYYDALDSSLSNPFETMNAMPTPGKRFFLWLLSQSDRVRSLCQELKTHLETHKFFDEEYQPDKKDISNAEVYAILAIADIEELIEQSTKWLEDAMIEGKQEKWKLLHFVNKAKTEAAKPVPEPKPTCIPGCFGCRLCDPKWQQKQKNKNRNRRKKNKQVT